MILRLIILAGTLRHAELRPELPAYCLANLSHMHEECLDIGAASTKNPTKRQVRNDHQASHGRPREDEADDEFDDQDMNDVGESRIQD